MYYSNFILKNDGTLWSTGLNDYGQLGLGDRVNRNVFTKVDIDNVKRIIINSRYSFSFIIKNDGTLWTCGDNTYGQLGLGDTTVRTIFTQINIDNVKDVYMDQKSTYILKNDGTLWAAGTCKNGEFGIGTSATIMTFRKINDNIKSCHLTTNAIHVLKNDGTLWATGYNYNGKLGVGDYTDRTSFTKVNITDIDSIVTSSYFVFILKTDGTLWGCGNSINGQLGLGNKIVTTFTKVDIDNIRNVYVGYNCSYVLKNDGTLWATGYNYYGQLGLGNTNNRSTFTQVNIDDVNNIYTPVTSDCTFILKNDGTLWGCGYNSSGQLGLGDTTNRSVFTQCSINVDFIDTSTSHTFILKNDKTLWSTGYNNNGGLGLGNNTTTIIRFTKVNIDDIQYINNIRILYIEQPLYELINIKSIADINISDNKVLLKLDTRCKVFRYKSKAKISVYYSLKDMDIDYELSEFAYDSIYSSGTNSCENPYIAKYILLVFDDTIDTDFEIWAEYDNGSISVGKITNESLSNITNDITNNMYISEDRYIHINDISGNYNRIRSIIADILFEGSISTVSDNSIGDLSQYKMFNIILSNGTDNISRTILELNTDITILDGVNNITINMNTSLHVISINGLTIISVIGIR